MQFSCKNKQRFDKMQLCCNKIVILTINILDKRKRFMKKGRNTIAKQEITDLLKDSDTALSHAEIQEKLSGLCDRVTIYRVLDRLIVEGLAHKIVHIDGVIRYAACHSCTHTHHEHQHVHFNCEKCHAVTCLESIRPEYALPQGYEVHDANFMLTGICPNCK